MARPVFMHTTRWHRAVQAAGLDAVIVASPNAIFYTTGALLPAQLKASPHLGARLVDDRPAFAVVGADGSSVLLVSTHEAPLVESETWAKRVETYAERTGSPVARLAELLDELGLAGARLGLELRYVTASQMQTLTARSGRARFEAADDLLQLVRAVKTPVEVDLLVQAGEATAEAIWRGFRMSRAGDTEKMVADRIAAALMALGADDLYLSVLGAGENSLHGHNKPGERRLERGDLVRVDFGGKFDGFASDLARMGVVGPPSEEQVHLYARCRKVQLETIRGMRAGVRAQEVYANCAQLFAGEGLALRFPHVGHAFALGGHDYPMLQPTDTTVLEPDMIFYVEPVYADARLGMIQIEDLVRVTPTGGTLLTGRRDNNTLWEIAA